MNNYMLILKLFIIFIISASAHASVKTTYAIANWDVVPNQVIEVDLNVGVVAFHSSGIKRVDFFVDNKFYKSVTQPSFNPQTKVKEYWITINPQQYSNKELLIKATALPFEGQAKQLDIIKFYPNPNKQFYKLNDIFVANSGDDIAGNGSYEKPYQSIGMALGKVTEGGKITIIEAGTYFFKPSIKKPSSIFWTSISGAANLNNTDVVLTLPTRSLLRLTYDKVKLQNMTLDFSKIITVYPENKQSIWFENVRWTDTSFLEGNNVLPLNYKTFSNPVRTSRDIEGYYVTDSIAEKMLSGFVDAKLARNIKVNHIVGDALTNNKLTINAEVTNILGNETEKHSDIFQVFGIQDNIILYNLLGYNIGGTAYRAKYNKVLNDGVQNIFLGTINSELSNVAVVNVCVQNKQLANRPPFSQLSSKQTNVLIQNVTTVNQNWKLRPDLSFTRKFVPNHVMIKDSNLPTILIGSKIGVLSLPFTADEFRMNSTKLNFSTQDAGYCQAQGILASNEK